MMHGDSSKQEETADDIDLLVPSLSNYEPNVVEETLHQEAMIEQQEREKSLNRNLN